jgi:hypothetical protein
MVLNMDGDPSTMGYFNNPNNGLLNKYKKKLKKKTL